MDANTIDIRGCNLEDAKDKVKGKISECIMNGYSSVYILHGHGSGGVLKSKLRNWLKSDKQKGIQSWAPADSADGGDAFTKLELL
jgi:dsDNA-specific endonuclease/ATPase MutS2